MKTTGKHNRLKYGVMFGNPGRRKTVEWYDTEFRRNLHADALKRLGYHVRKISGKVSRRTV